MLATPVIFDFEQFDSLWFCGVLNYALLITKLGHFSLLVIFSVRVIDSYLTRNSYLIEELKWSVIFILENDHILHISPNKIRSNIEKL